MSRNKKDGDIEKVIGAGSIEPPTLRDMTKEWSIDDFDYAELCRTKYSRSSVGPTLDLLKQLRAEKIEDNRHRESLGLSERSLTVSRRALFWAVVAVVIALLAWLVPKPL